MKKIKYAKRNFPVSGMDCSSCVLVIEKRLNEIEGVKEAKANYLLGKVSITYDPEKVLVSKIEDAIEKLGYRISYKKYPSTKEKLSRVLGRKKSADQK